MTRRELEITDAAEIREILLAGRVVHLGLCDGDQPYVVPMNYGFTMEDGVLTLYLHGAIEGYKYDVMRRNPKVSFSIEDSVQPFEGKVACQYGTAYRSVFGRGIIEIFDNPADKIFGLETIMKTQTGKDFALTETLVSIVQVMKIFVTEYTAKQRRLPAAVRKANGEDAGEV